MHGQTPPGWIRLGAENQAGKPLWTLEDQAIYVATDDMDLLRFIGAALVRFDRMSPRQFDQFVTVTR